MRVVCAWCNGKEISFRREDDLKQNVMKTHKSVLKELCSDAFGEPNCFWVVKHPKDYKKIVKPTDRPNADAVFFRKAIKSWLPTLTEKSSKNLQDWREAWAIVPILESSPSPTLDFVD